MLDGLKSGIDTFDYRLKAGIEGVTGSGGRIGGITQATTFYTPDLLTVVIGAQLTTATYSAGVGPPGVAGKQASFDIPALFLSQTFSDATFGDCISYLDFIGCRAIVMPSGVYELNIATIEWYVNGVLQWSSSAGWSLTSAMAPAPSSFPLWGIPPRITGGSSTAFAPTVGCVGSLGAQSINASGQSTAGWEVKIDGAWVQAPIELFPHTETANTGSITAVDCSDITINHAVLVTAGAFGSTSNLKNGEVWALPNWDTTMQKMFVDYEELILRWGFPKVERFDNDPYTEFDCEGEVINSSGGTTYSEIYALDTQFLSTVTDAEHIIEGPLTRTKYAPCNVGGYENINWSTGYSQQFWGSGMFPVIDDSTMAPNLTNIDATYGYMAEYLNTVTHPDSSFGLWFPKDDASSAVRWDLLGADSEIAYWLANRQQHVTHPALPGGEDTRRRTNIISEALDQNGVTGNAQAMIDCPCNWGTDLLQLSNETYPVSLVTDASSAPRFTTPTMGATVTVDGSGITI